MSRRPGRMDIGHLRLVARLPFETWSPKRDTRRRVVATIRSVLADPGCPPSDRLVALRVLVRLARLNGSRARDLIRVEAVAIRGRERPR